MPVTTVPNGSANVLVMESPDNSGEVERLHDLGVTEVLDGIEEAIAMNKSATVIVLSSCFLHQEDSEMVTIRLVDSFCCAIISNTPGLLIVKTPDHAVITVHFITAFNHFAPVGSSNFASIPVGASDEEDHGANDNDSHDSSATELESIGSLAGSPPIRGAESHRSGHNYDSTDDSDGYEVCDTQDVCF